MSYSKGKEFIKKAKNLQSQGDLNTAEIYYTQALEHEDSALIAHESLGALYLNKGDAFKAVEHWEKALAIDDSNFESLTNLGYILVQMQRLPDALNYLQKAHVLTPERDDVAMQISQILCASGRYDEAEKILDPFIKKRTDNENVHLLMAQAKALRNDIQGATESLLNLLKIKPNSSEALINLGQLAEGLGDITKATEYYEQAVTNVPYHFQAKLEYGRFLTNLGKEEEGLKQLQAAEKIQPNDWAVHVHLGNLYQALGEFDKAIKSYQSSLSINPNDLGVRQNLSRVLSRFVPPWHLKMLADHERNDAYQQAIEKAVNKDSVVLDIGTGSGILSMMAAKAGAKHVITCEQSEYIAKAAQTNIKKNGYDSKIDLFTGKSTQLKEEDLSQKPNLIVAEIFDSGLLGEHAIPSFRHALSTLCEPDTVVIPKSGSIKGRLIHAERAASVNPIGEISGFDLSGFDQFRVPDEYITQNLSEITHEFCSQEFDILEANFNEPWGAFAPGQYKWYEIEVPINSNKPIHGVAFWFIINLDDEIQLSSAPGRLDNHWGQAISFFEQPLKGHEGQTLKLKVCYHDIKIWFEQPEIA